MTQMTWKSWNGTSAWATGKLWFIKPNCYPQYKCPLLHPLGRGLHEHGENAQRPQVFRQDVGQVPVRREVALGRRLAEDVPRGLLADVAVPRDGAPSL